MLPPRALIGMVHLASLPGAPRSRRTVADIARAAADEARILAKAGFDAVIVENMHDAPYVNAHGPEVVAAMTRAALAVRDAVPDLVLGVQVLSLGHREALAVALAADAAFIRVENFVFAHVADEGLLPEAVAGPLLRYRRQIGADRIKVFADVKKKHASHAITADLSLAETVHAAEFFGADGIIVTGAFTGQPVAPADLRDARRASSIPVLVGSGVNAASLPAVLRDADAVIVGSSIKRGGRWHNPVDPARARAFVKARGA